ncbi:zinc finger CCCH domain-containing protein 34 [Lactuca sativa]|uniref:C3H1-type domain-containing protein n=1 Tax=Lactuca sativa TaxID=4236 RepID=A0A9R1W5E9_LACSA|nr:zinc finger CCCH domain-containing protein 34 [Lactuca sativa]KAJ0216263.1 hypothetical protein LSAT_V11C300110440 [Lactuca sativa]
MEMSQSDPVTEWNTSGGQTGLEEPMWQLGLESYPERPDEADCIYYLRTGFCGYGSRCRFNHPRDRSSVVGAMRSAGGEYPQRIGQPVCQYYMRTGMCKFGASCKYHHPRHGIGSSTTVLLNMSGYPLRPGEKECSYYVKTGQCKFGMTCKFHHPQPVGIAPSPPPPPPPESFSPMAASVTYQSMQSPVASSQQYGVFSGNWPVSRPSLLPGSYLAGSYGPPVMLPPGMVPFPGWNPYQAPVNPNSNVGGGSMYAISPSHLSPAVPSYVSMAESAFPERPGEAECQYYLKTGDCKFGSSCRYHHPREWNQPKTNFMLSPMGLPLRPGAAVCTHYAQKGVCKFGPSCKFDHPMGGGGTLSYSSSASSLADMSVAPYPVGTSIGTLAPSSSSSDIVSATNKNKDGLSTSTSTSISVASGSVGSSLSQSMPLSLSKSSTAAD